MKPEAQIEAVGRVLARCEEAALFSEQAGGITRTFLSEPLSRLHSQIKSWMERAGMAVRVDAAANLIGHYPGRMPDTPVLIIGSHIDTVPNAGKYDGVLGVILGLAAIEALGGRPLPFGVDVVAFSDEEGVRYRAPFLGSLAVCGRFDGQLLERTDRDGVAMSEAFRSFGLDPARISEAAYPSGSILAYVEPHIEQGPILEQAGAPVGVVTSIAGQSRIWVELKGAAGHSGTTPMEGRRDALAAAAELALEVERLGRSVAGLRATVGTLTARPGAVNVIAGSASASIDIRHAEDTVRIAAVAEIKARTAALAARRGVEIAIVNEQDQPSVPVDPGLCDLLAEAVSSLGFDPYRLPSGAGHDAAIMASVAPMAMLFVRSPGGVSHHPDERVEPADVAVALAVLERFLDMVAGRVAATGLSTVLSHDPELLECRSSEQRAAACGRRTP